MTDEFANQGGLNQSIYDRRKTLVAAQWAKYQETKDPEHLAVVCRELPFFEHPEVGEEIARLLSGKDEKDRMLKLMWQRYRHDSDPQWLMSMVAINAFENKPMPNEISREFAKVFAEFTRKGPKIRKNVERDEMVCRLYALLYPEHEEKYNKSAIRDISDNFLDLNEEAIRTILRRKFDLKKHVSE